MTENILR